MLHKLPLSSLMRLYSIASYDRRAAGTGTRLSSLHNIKCDFNISLTQSPVCSVFQAEMPPCHCFVFAHSLCSLFTAAFGWQTQTQHNTRRDVAEWGIVAQGMKAVHCRHAHVNELRYHRGPTGHRAKGVEPNDECATLPALIHSFM